MTPEDQTRIEFAKRIGWKPSKHSWTGWENAAGNIGNPPSNESREDVHNALMGMSDEEWKEFCQRIWTMLPYPNFCPDLVKEILIMPLPTLASCFLEATKGRAKK